MTPHQPNPKALEPEALADLASGVAHEIRNPVNTISLASQVLQKLFEKKGLDLEEFREYFGVIHFELGKIKKIIDNFVSFSRVPDLALKPTSIKDLLTRLSDSLTPQAEEKGISFSLSVVEDGQVDADTGHLSEAFVNILQNSIETLQSGGKIQVLVSTEGGSCRVIIRDSGPGFQLENPDRIFNPYYSTVPGGLGLGLTLSRSIIESHRGTIRAVSREEGGAEFVIQLPLIGKSDEEPLTPEK